MEDNLDPSGNSANTTEAKYSGFAHLMRVGRINSEGAFSIAPGLEIRKASVDEARQICERLPKARSRAPDWPTRNPYETAARLEVAESYKRLRLDPIPEAEWRYYVVAFEGSNARAEGLAEASILTNSRLELGYTIVSVPGFTEGPATVGNFATISRISEGFEFTDDPFLSVDVATLEDLKGVIAKLSSMTDEQIQLQAAMRQFVQLDEIPRGSPLRFLGYVSILESLITHAPKATDPTDSLTRQVRQKMILVGNRSILKIPYDRFGSNHQHSTLWNKLYEYRSAVAHGATPDFGSGLSILRSAEAALEFISRATVALMRQVLEEPRLIADLRAC